MIAPMYKIGEMVDIMCAGVKKRHRKIQLGIESHDCSLALGMKKRLNFTEEKSGVKTHLDPKIWLSSATVQGDNACINRVIDGLTFVYCNNFNVLTEIVLIAKNISNQP